MGQLEPQLWQARPEHRAQTATTPDSSKRSWMFSFQSSRRASRLGSCCWRWPPQCSGKEKHVSIQNGFLTRNPTPARVSLRSRVPTIPIPQQSASGCGGGEGITEPPSSPGKLRRHWQGGSLVSGVTRWQPETRWLTSQAKNMEGRKLHKKPTKRLGLGALEGEAAKESL
jgi:hypothetical protein